MKTLVVRLLLALVLLAAGAVCWGEARMVRRVAEAHQRLATLHYDNDESDAGDAEVALIGWPLRPLSADVRRHRATVAYWHARQLQSHADSAAPFDANTPPTAPSLSGDDPDPELLFVAANADFRASERLSGDRAVLVARLDRVVQSYAEVLRLAPGHADAAYNYEYVMRLRDTVARGRGPVRPREPAQNADAGDFDLPGGPTVHGRPGGPPPESPGDQFQTIIPMPFEERQDAAPGRTVAPRRRG
jgi:hypothetical protein